VNKRTPLNTWPLRLAIRRITENYGYTWEQIENHVYRRKTDEKLEDECKYYNIAPLYQRLLFDCTCFEMLHVITAYALLSVSYPLHHLDLSSHVHG